MLRPTVYIAILLLVGFDGGSANTYFNEVNSPINFAKKIDELLKSNLNLSPQCDAHMKLYIKGIFSGNQEDTWALQMFDAGAKIPSGVLEGNLADLGSFDECINIEANVGQTDIIHGQYCLGTMPIDLGKLLTKNNRKQSRVINPLFEQINTETRAMGPGGEIGGQLAKCVPSTCNVTDMEKMYSYLGLKFYKELCQTKFSRPELDGGSIATISFLGVILWIMLLSTAYDVVLQYFDRKTHYSIFIAFSVFTNGKKILATSDSPNQISCLHGIRVISTMWIILSHKYGNQSTFPLKNFFEVFNWMTDETSMFILGATVSVDSFFLMAGLVISYSYVAAVTKGVKFNIIMYYVHRYLRLTPVLAVIMLIHITLLRHMGSGPFWPYVVERDLISSCEKYWWKTLLYIQNYGSQEAYCIPQSWYLSVDTQLFLLSPILLIPLSKWPMYTLAATGFLTVCSIATSFLTGWFFKLNSNLIGNTQSLDQVMNYSLYYYNATQTRAAPWLIGLLVGYAIFHIKQKKTELIVNKLIMLLGWVISLAVLCTCVFAGHDLIFGKYDRVANAFHISLIRPAWAVALGFVIFACVFGYGGPINWFLSLPVFQIVSKLTYTLYLSHFTLLYIKTAQMRDIPRFSNGQLMYEFWGDFAFTMVVSFILTLAFESPIITIEKSLFGRTKKKEIVPPPSEEYKTKSIETA